MKNIFHSIAFSQSAPTLASLPADSGLEVAFAGRSNAGKSSAINAITHQKSLARTSKTPGRTQAINFFPLNEQKRLVDLPGYGYAKVSQQVKNQWQANLGKYLQSRQCLQGLILLTDIRRPLEPGDLRLFDWCIDAKLPVHILVTKADKLSRGKAIGVLQKLQSTLKIYQNNEVSMQLFSALKRQGLEQATEVIANWLQIPLQE